jgi:hypothetical protein
MRSDAFKFNASLFVGCGIPLMFLGSLISKEGGLSIVLSIFTFVLGWASLIWGCVNYFRWKGYSGWLGLFGYLLLPGLIVLVCFPNNRNRLFATDDAESVTARKRLLKEDKKDTSR